ncbi:hypothetical protein [Sorangium atrum]|uniref:Uncharacterized protein n=1 Tax=Sorangium atrum TaxID=2995308 RepID=A0ABT5C5X4_9BACT|nr:hypothetical protein [Sorangium aterium]MDC0681827.1 hypothetical protein [Sorangium aterium]
MEANLRPIPPPHDEDNEDVHWALSTATALWGRGERDEALKWLRRAAEQASDANADLRALELFKAAAEVAQKIAALDADTATASQPPTASAPPNAALSAPPQGSGAPAATASAPPPRPSAPGAPARPSRPPGAEAGRAERGGAGTSAPPAAMRAPSVRAPAGDAPTGPLASAVATFRDGAVPRPAAGVGRPSSVVPGRAPAPVSAAALREVTPTQLSPAARAPSHAPGLPARPGAATKTGAPPGAAASTAASPGRAVPANARAITGFAASPHGRVSSTTAVTEEVPVVRLPAAGAFAGQEPGQGASEAARESDSGEQPADADPPADQRATVPTPTAMAAALARRPAVPLGAGSSQEATERRPGLWPSTDEEGTARRPLTPQEQRVLMELRIEDLDEETPMLALEQLAGDGKAPAAAPEAGPASDDRADWTEAEPDEADAGIASADQQGDGEPSDAVQGRGAEGAASWSQGAPTDDRGGSSEDSSWSDPPYEGEWQAPPPRLPASQIEPLPALRIAVIGISSAGELRLVPMDGRNAPPRGAALGILVPLSPGDGETIARLLQLRS